MNDLSGDAEKTATELSEALGPLGTTVLGIYLVLLPIVLLWTMVALFPESPTLLQRRMVQGSDPGQQITAKSSSESLSGGATGQDRPGTEQQVATTPTPRFPARTLVRIGDLRIPIGPFNEDQGMLLLAILAGCLGSYLHAAQSFAAYVGNRQARRSWVWWYVLRAPIGGALGVLFYFVIRAGLTAGSTDVNPYGVVAFGGLAGWFSKQATDKLAEVFDTLFRTQKPVEYKDSLATKPVIHAVTPSPVPAQQDIMLRITGEGFSNGALVKFGTTELPAQVTSATMLSVHVLHAQRPETGTVAIVVINPDRTSSKPFPLVFE